MTTEIRYQSTNAAAPIVGFREALLAGIAPDGGLYLPDRLPALSRETLAGLADTSYAEVATAVLAPFVDFPRDELATLCADTYTFPVPVEPVDDRRAILRLDQGPTCSFKDFAARLMARLFGRYLAAERQEMIILTATSGDTGSAVASAFEQVPGVRVVVLFPIREVSDRQRRQMTTLGDSVTAVAVEGTFDDCQALVKRAFADPVLKPLNLSSANSINIGRLLPQMVYYFWAWARIGMPKEFVAAVPCGNFGDITAGLLAKQIGLPIARCIAAVNANDEFPVFLADGNYRPIVPSKVCISNAMNVGHPSNLARIVALYGGSMDEKGAIHRQPDLAALRRDFIAESVSDDDTRAAIARAWREQGVILEPHGAVAWEAIERRATDIGDLPVVSLETAHPAKFPESVEAELGIEIPLPPPLARASALPERYRSLPATYDSLVRLLRMV